MTISLPEAHQHQLQTLATGAGYASVELYVQDCLMAITSASLDAETTDWTEEELQEFAAMCDRGMEDVKAGRVMSIDEARRRIHEGSASKSRAT